MEGTVVITSKHERRTPCKRNIWEQELSEIESTKAENFLEEFAR